MVGISCLSPPAPHAVPTTCTTTSNFVYMNGCLPQGPCRHSSSLLAGILPRPICLPLAQTGACISNSGDKCSQDRLALLSPPHLAQSGPNSYKDPPATGGEILPPFLSSRLNPNVHEAQSSNTTNSSHIVSATI